MSESGKSELEEAVRRVLGALDGLQYGAIEIAVHDGQIVRITRTESVRIPNRTAEEAKPRPRT